MKKENGLAYQILILVIIIIIAIAGVLINKVVGRNGVIEKVTEVENKFSKEDVLEKINYKTMQKFIELNNIAKETNQNISDIYNSNIVIEFLEQNLIIEKLYDENGNWQDGIYNISVEKLQDENENNQITGKFRLEKRNENYFVIYYDENENAQEIGELQIQKII